MRSPRSAPIVPARWPRSGALAASNPDAPVFQTTYARALKEAGQLQAALAVYRQALRRWPTDAALFHDLAVTARDAANAAPGGIGRARPA